MKLLLLVHVSLVACCLSPLPAAAETVLTVDLATSMGPVRHAASGSLYGVTEALPADIEGLVSPLRPNMFTNPAANVQQPVGDAIVVAERVAATGARVTIRLADWFSGFYAFTNMTDWFDKIGQTVARKQAAHLTNVYAYEIWNEPNDTYSGSNSLPFNEFWCQTFAKLRQLDPDAKITGPSISYYNETYLRDFLSYTKSNDCLPDVVGWHELGGANLTSDFQRYRALEQELGIGPLPISINEYSNYGRLEVEGQPGASAPMIAKFERFGVDTACISFWDVPHPGRLGSLLATNTAPNGGWWFYKWYGDMTGTMVSTTPPKPNSANALDGFASVDASAGSAAVLLGGSNDGTIRVVVSGFAAATFFGSVVHVVVERTPFVNRTTIVGSPDTLSESNLAVADDQIAVTIPNTNASDGYRLILTPTPAGPDELGVAGAAGDASGGADPGGKSAAGGSRSKTQPSSRDDTGCGCRVMGQRNGSSWRISWILWALLTRSRRRSRSLPGRA